MTLQEMVKILCCPSGACLHPEGCYTKDRGRAVNVNLWESAEALRGALTPKPSSELQPGDHPV